MPNDKLKYAIIASWCVLAFCFIIKLLGSNVFVFVCTNEKVIALCNFIDKTFLLYITNFALFYFGTFYYYKAVLKEKVLTRRTKYIHLVLLGQYFIKLLIQFLIPAEAQLLLVLIFDTTIFILAPIILKRDVWKRALFGIVLLYDFQLVSMFIRNLGIHFAVSSTLLVAMFSIDYYIMILLYYFYSIKEKKGDV